MEIVNLFPGSFASNCYLLLSHGEAAVIDPSANARVILDEIGRRGVKLQYILLTHGHFDHILTLDELRDASGVPAYIHSGDADIVTDAQKNAFRYFFGTSRAWRPCECTLSDGDELTLGGESIRVLHTPGHSLGSVCFLCGNDLITGDTLFDGNVGRTDLFGGDAASLFSSLQKLSALPRELTIYPGHGDTARLGASLDVFL
ncbi:MAG: MBL fold metallo-hydrolase [Clostridia bacterium]|nr:MBL fold metallo-hydrolase [Clostridia bacterium]